MWQAKSGNGLAIHLTYGVYDSIHPAVFNRVSHHDSDNHSLLTPPTSPLNSFTDSPPTSPPILSSPITGEAGFPPLFLTSEIGQRSAGILHSGVVEVDVDQKPATLQVIAKLAFVKKHQSKLFHELAVYTHLASKDVKGVPPVLGIFHNAKDKGPYCFVIGDAGLSIHDRKANISVPQRYTYALAFPLVSLTDGGSSSYQFLAVLKSIHNAGIIHGNLRRDNLLVNDTGEVAIVDFDQARLSYDTKEYERERQSLVDILESALHGSVVHPACSASPMP
jgi:hypothetical protein